MRFALGLLLVVAAAFARSKTVLKTCAKHPMQYYLSLPMGWKAGGKWPVVVVIDSAERTFNLVATAFEKARGARPYIIVTPLVLTNGGARAREVSTYHYSPAVWAQDPWQFDVTGLRAVLDEVSVSYGAFSVFITGLEAAGHTVYGLVFSHPSWFKGTALITPNYAGRWVGTVADGAGLPVRVFVGAEDDLAPKFKGQWERAQALAQQHRFGASIVTVPRRGHEAMPDVILQWFDQLRG